MAKAAAVDLLRQKRSQVWERHSLARLTALRIRLVSEKKKLKRIQIRVIISKYRSLKAKIFQTWDDYVNPIV